VLDRYAKAAVQVLTIHAAERTAVDVFSFPEMLRPFDAATGWSYDCIFADAPSYHEGFGDAYGKYGVDRARGCVVVARPDQYVGYIGELEDVGEVEAYFESILLPVEGRGGREEGQGEGKGEGVPPPTSRGFEVVNERAKGAEVTAKPLDAAAGSVM